MRPEGGMYEFVFGKRLDTLPLRGELLRCEANIRQQELGNVSLSLLSLNDPFLLLFNPLGAVDR